jgi:hypothetical protein
MWESLLCFPIVILHQNLILTLISILMGYELSIRYNLSSTCVGECDWLFHWQHKSCATFSASVNINYRLPIKVYYRISTLRQLILGNQSKISSLSYKLLYIKDFQNKNVTCAWLNKIRCILNDCGTCRIVFLINGWN